MLMRPQAQLSLLLLSTIGTVAAATAEHETVSFDCEFLHTSLGLRATLLPLSGLICLLHRSYRRLALPPGPCRLIATCTGASAAPASTTRSMQRRETQSHVPRKRHRAAEGAMPIVLPEGRSLDD